MFPSQSKGKSRGGFKGGKAGGKFGGKPFKKRSFGGGKSFGGKGFGRDGERPVMHSAVCDNCKKECEVPFKPSGDRPVFCSNCFKKPEDGESFGRRESFGRKDFGKRADTGSGNAGSPNVGSWNADQFKKQFDALNTKLDRIIKLIDPSAGLDESMEIDEDEDDDDGGEK